MRRVKKSLWLGFILFCSVFLVCQTVSAIPSVGDLAIDFRSTDWEDAYGLNEFTFNGITVKALREVNGNLEDADLFWASDDGLGIKNGTQDDEVDNLEVLEIYFSPNWFLSYMWITDLFKASDGVTGEKGQITLYDPETNIVFEGVEDLGSSNGELMVDLGFNSASKAVFKTFGGQPNNEFSVAGFKGAPVPEPATMVLLGLGLIGLGTFGRKKGLFAKKAK